MPEIAREPLTLKSVNGAKPAAKLYRLRDATVPGLLLRVTPAGKKVWAITWGRGQERVIGVYPVMTLDMARDAARIELAEAAEHGAPLAVVEARKPAAAKPLTFGEFIQQHYAPWALSHQKAGKATLDGIKATFGDFYKKPLAELCAFDLERFKSKRLKAGIKPATVNRDLDRIRSALSRAVEWGMLEKHPLKTVKRAKGDDNTRVRYLTTDEEARVRAALAKREQARRERRDSGNDWCEARGGEGRQQWMDDQFTDHLMPLVLLAMNTGLRRGELFGLTWEHVNLDRRMLTVAAGTAKSGKARHVPLNNEAHDVLSRWRKQGSGRGLVFRGAARRKDGGDDFRLTNINRSWAGLVADAELVDFHFHDLRHHFASRLVQAGVDLYTVKELLGHSDFAMTQRYAHLQPDHLAAAVARLGMGV